MKTERIRPSLQCSSVVHPHAVMALKQSVEKEADTTVEGCEVCGASSEELTSVRRVTNQKELLSVFCSLCKLMAAWLTSSWAIQRQLCRPCLFITGAKKAAHLCSWEHFPCLTQDDCHKEVLFIFQHQGMLCSHKNILQFFSLVTAPF